MKVTLRKPHEHAGRMCNPGDVIELADDLAQWLCQIESAQPVLQAADAAKPSKQSNPTQE